MLADALIKTPLKRLISALGIEIAMTRATGSLDLRIARRQNQPAHALPPLLEGPLEALHYCRGGKSAAFMCPIGKCVTVNGLSFSTHGWHPFSAALMEYQAGQAAQYSGSILERYYTRWQPATAADALIDLAAAPPRFKSLPPYLLYLFPWSARTVPEASLAIQKWSQDDHLEHNGPTIGEMAVSLKDHGPVDGQVAWFEYQRLTSLYDRIKRDGFRRERGDIRVVLIRRGNDFRFLNFGGGLHRTAAMAALGQEAIPAAPLNQLLIDTADVEYWPQVRSGVWTKSTALAYIDHLFDFDSAGWAAGLGLLTSPKRNSVAPQLPASTSV